MIAYLKRRRGLALGAIVLLVLPLIPPFDQEDIRRWLVAGAWAPTNIPLPFSIVS